MHLDSIFDIADRYDTFLVDMWGVVYDGVHAFPAAVGTLNQLRDQGKNIIFVSNNPRPSHLAKTILKSLGIDESVDVVTSGDVMRRILQEEHPGQRVYHLGRLRNRDILAGIDVFETDDPEQGDFALLSCFLEETEDFTQFDRELEQLARQQMLVYCPNPDIHAAHHKSLRKTSGFFARRLEEEFGGKVVRIGKPNRVIFEFVERHHAAALSDKSRVLMIGDTVATDIQGGQDFGIATLFVEDGISGLLKDALTVQPTYTIKKLK